MISIASRTRASSGCCFLPGATRAANASLLTHRTVLSSFDSIRWSSGRLLPRVIFLEECLCILGVSYGVI